MHKTDNNPTTESILGCLEIFSVYEISPEL